METLSEWRINHSAERAYEIGTLPSDCDDDYEEYEEEYYPSGEEGLPDGIPGENCMPYA